MEGPGKQSRVKGYSLKLPSLLQRETCNVEG